MMASHRPGGVVLIAILAWIGAVLQFALGILVVNRTLNPEGVSTSSGWVAIVVGAITFIVAFALFSGSNFARILVTISFVLSVISAIFSILAHPANFVGPAIAGIIAVIGLLLLYTKTANEYFRR